MTRKIIYPQTKDVLIILLLENYIDKKIGIIAFVNEDLNLKNTKAKEAQIKNTDSINQLSLKSFNDIWDAPENEHWDKFLASKI
jgi:hypothetical protein